MTEDPRSTDSERDALIAQLASLEDASRSEKIETPDDSTLKELKGELDTLLSDVRQPPPVDEFEDESGCRRAIEIIQAIGQDPSFAGDRPAGHTAVEAQDLGSLREYQLLSKLGEGGMGTVYKALHSRLKKIVAVKVLPTERMENGAAVARFSREMEAVGKLEHPNIVRATDAGDVDGQHFLVMEHVDGLDLSEIVRASGPLAVPDACEAIRQAATGLQHAHEHGLVHRDIKPSNLMISVVASLREADSRSRGERPTVKILDMGLALLEEQRLAEQRDLTSTGQMMGTLDYMAPEQGADSHEVDIRADIYSLGATIFKLLTGEAPFSTKRFSNPVKMLMAIANEPAPSIAAMRQDLPRGLAEVIDRMLAKLPEDRFATPQQVADALAPFVAGADLAGLLEQATCNPVTEDQATAATHESLKSSSVETDPTIDLQSSPHAPREDSGIEPTLDGSSTLVHQPAPAPHRLPHAEREGYKRPLTIAAALLGCILLAALTFFIRTNNGTIIVEIDDPEGLIQVTVDGEDIIISDKQKAGEPITLKAGKHRLHVQRGGLEFDSETFTLKRGDKVVVTVKLAQGQVTVIRDETTAMGNHDLIETQGENYTLAFDGKSSYVEIPSLDYDKKRCLTVEAWVAPNDTQYRYLFNANYADRTISLFMHPDGVRGRRWLLEHHDETHARQQSSSEASTPNGTTHIAGVWDDTRMQIFINGKLQTNHQQDFPMGGRQFHNTPTIIGANATRDLKARPESFFQGTIDEMRISNVARYTEGFTPQDRFETDEHTLALYHFDEGTGDVLKDSSGNNHHGKIVAATWVGSDYAETDFAQTTPTFQGDGITASLHVTLGQHGGISGLLFSPDGSKLLSTAHGSWPANPSVKGTAKLWDIASRRDLFTIEDRTFGLLGPAFSPSGELFSIGAEGWAKAFETKTGREKATFLSRYDTFWGTSFSPDGSQFATASIHHKLQLWDAATGEKIQEIDAHNNRLYQVRYSPDGKLIVSCAADGLIKLWNAQTLELVQTLAGHTSRVPSVVFHPDGRKLISGSWDGTIKVWDANTGMELRTLRSHTDQVASVDLSPDGALLASASSDGTIKFWDVEHGKLLLTIDGQHVDIVSRVCFSPDGKLLASAHHTIKLWDLEYVSQ